MKQIIATAAKCFVSVLILDLMCFFIYGSFVTVGLAVGETEVSHYQIVVYDENGDPIENNSYTPDEKVTKEKELKAEKAKYDIQPIKVLANSTKSFVEILTGICSLLILFGMIYTTTWARGDKDHNLATFGDGVIDKLKGLKIGLTAVIPFALLYVFLIVDKFLPNELYALGAFKTANYYLFPLVDAVSGSASTANDLSILSVLGLISCMLFIPAFAVLGYFCGSNEISIKEKLLYIKKEKK